MALPHDDTSHVFLRAVSDRLRKEVERLDTAEKLGMKLLTLN